jgi:enoyl-CoA hydratase
MTYKNLLLDITDAVAVVTVNRPEKLNALNRETLLALGDCFAALAADSAAGAVILTGAGEKAFVAGADIADLAGLDALAAREWARLGQRVFSQIEAMTKPVIAAVNGYALGGGLELAMACHLRIASENARLGLPELKLGIIPGNGGTQRLPRLVGRGRALEMMLTGEPVSAAEAHRIGLVNRVVAPAALLESARALARQILTQGPLAIAFCLEAVHYGLQMPLAVAFEWEASLSGLVTGTEDAREGLHAFLAKRPPQFAGR